MMNNNLNLNNVYLLSVLLLALKHVGPALLRGRCILIGLLLLLLLMVLGRKGHALLLLLLMIKAGKGLLLLLLLSPLH